MHEVRVHYNRDEGTRWWAEDSLGFTGGADDLEALIAAAIEWADSEGVLEDLEFRLKSNWTVADLSGSALPDRQAQWARPPISGGSEDQGKSIQRSVRRQM